MLTVTTLCQLLGKYSLAMEMASIEFWDVSTPALNPNPSHTNQRNRPPHFRSTTGGLVAGNNSRGSTPPRQFQVKCVHCNQSHWSVQCPTYSTLQESKEKLKGSCYNCIQRGTPSKNVQRIESVHIVVDATAITVVYVINCSNSPLNYRTLVMWTKLKAPL